LYRPPEDYESSGKNSAKNQEPVAKVAILGARQSETIGNGMEPPNRTPQTLDRRRPDGSVVDRTALMFLKEITPYVATDARFWLWLTFAAAGGGFKDLVNNRFSGGSAANYGFDNLPECLFFRLWWRGYKMPEEDYNLAKRGDIDLWRSHLIRVEISYPEVMVHHWKKLCSVLL
jgi:hypothetical protein